MRQRRVATLALPLPAAKGQEVSAVGTIDLKCNRRHEGAGVTGSCRAAPAGESLLEELADFAFRIREVAGGGIAVVRSDDQGSRDPAAQSRSHQDNTARSTPWRTEKTAAALL